jgi:hypothetical protein
MMVKARENSGGRNGRLFPVVRLLLYYGALVLVGGLLIAFVPGFRDALVAPIAVPPSSTIDELVTGGHPTVTGPALPWPGLGGRGALAFTAMVWALAMALPVAWCLKHTRQLRYDPSLVQTLIVLPIVVSGVVLVVKNSLPLAFALAGIVAGVRFRQKLDEPEQAVYVLLALGIGLAAGVQALDVALVLSMTFSLVVLTLWRYDIGAVFQGGRGAQFAIGDARLLLSTLSDTRREAKERAAAIADGLKADGMLVVRAEDPAAARQGIEIVLGRMASAWRITDPVTGGNRGGKAGLARFEVLLQLKKDGDPAELIAELEARWSERITAAEYIPFGDSNDDDD